MSAEVLRYSAFTSEGRGGNPAGVVLDAGVLTSAQMLSIAQTIGYSETAFVIPAGTRGDTPTADIRFFSPLAEVAFCGHATIAASVAMAERSGALGRIELTTPAGLVIVQTWQSHDGLGATLTSPAASSRPATSAELDDALAAFGWRTSDLSPDLPPAVAFAGNHHLMLPTGTRRRLADMHYDFDVLADVMERYSWTTVNVFWPESGTVFHSRNPFPPGGVLEDPATGAAAAAFGGYVREIGVARPPLTITIHQGVDMGAPSRLIVDLEPGLEGIKVGGLATRLTLSPYEDLESL